MILTYSTIATMAKPNEPGARGFVFWAMTNGAPTDPIEIRAYPAIIQDGLPPQAESTSEPPEPDIFYIDPADGTPIDPTDGRKLDPAAHPAWAPPAESITGPVQAVRRFSLAYRDENLISLRGSGFCQPGYRVSARLATRHYPDALHWIQGRPYLIDILACSTRDCRCTEYGVVFEPFQGDPDAEPAYGLIDRATGQPVEAPDNPAHVAAAPLLRAMLARPGAVTELDRLHGLARETAIEIHSPFRWRAATLRADERCPCGSRKVYRRCCGARRPPPVDLDLERSRTEARRQLLDFAADLVDLDQARAQAIEHLGPGVPDDLITWYLLYSRRTPHFTIAGRWLAEAELRQDPNIDERARRYLQVVNGTPIGVYAVGPVNTTSATLLPLLDDHPPLKLPPSKGARWQPGELLLAVVPEIAARPHFETCWRLGLTIDDARSAELLEIVDHHENHVNLLLDPTDLIRDLLTLLHR